MGIQNNFKAYDGNIYIYCGTCAGMITKSKKNVEQILCKLISEDENISTGISTVKNRGDTMARKIIIDCHNTCSVDGCDIDDGLAIIYTLFPGYI